MHRLIIIILLSLVMGACVPSKEISFDRLAPAEYTFPENSESILIFNHAYNPSIDPTGSNIVSRLESREAFIVDTIIINSIFNGFFSVADNSVVPALLNTVYFEQRASDTTGFLKPLNKSDIAFLCDQFETDIVIALEYYSMRYFIEYEYVEASEDDFFLFSLGEVMAIRGIERKLLWRIYHPEQGLLNEELQSDTLYWSATGRYRSTAEENLTSLVDAVREAFWFAGEEYALSISPKWKRTDRLYFDLNDGREDRSLDTEYLIDQVKNASDIRKFKSLYNLAVIHERRGEPEKAAGFMEAALEIKPNSAVAKVYLRDLNKIISDMEIVRKQIGENSSPE